jgi:hypothetical protein
MMEKAKNGSLDIAAKVPAAPPSIVLNNSGMVSPYPALNEAQIT